MSTPLNLPFPPLVVIPVNGPLTWPMLQAAIGERVKNGVSFLLVKEQGPANRGGYFFHLKRVEKGFAFSTFDRHKVCEFHSGERCAAFVNHVAGLQYSEEMWHVAQRVNLRTDAD